MTPDLNLAKDAARLLAQLGAAHSVSEPPAEAARALFAADLVVAMPGGGIAISDAGRAFLARARHARAARKAARSGDAVSTFRAQHMALAEQRMVRDGEPVSVTVNDNESPLAWLARRKGRDGRALISTTQFLAGERLRADFTRAQMTPRMSANWSAPMASGRRGFAHGGADISDVIVAARQKLQQALAEVGPELSGLLLDVCCFLRGLEDVERARGWPPRSAKVVLQMGLDRLARVYGLAESTRGSATAPVRAWSAPDAAFTPDGR